jgi:hypothetical protein
MLTLARICPPPSYHRPLRRSTSHIVAWNSIGFLFWESWTFGTAAILLRTPQGSIALSLLCLQAVWRIVLGLWAWLETVSLKRQESSSWRGKTIVVGQKLRAWAVQVVSFVLIG